jgi:hypothetical protein
VILSIHYCRHLFREINLFRSNTLMGLLRRAVISAVGMRAVIAATHHDDQPHSSNASPNDHHRAHIVQQKDVQPQKEKQRYTGIPAIPSDIAYHSGKETAGKKKSGVAAQALGNPAVVLGLGLTAMALLGMIRKSVLGDKLGTQRFMQYRIMAQSFTVLALVAGIVLYGVMSGDEEEKEASAPAKVMTTPSNSAN